MSFAANYPDDILDIMADEFENYDFSYSGFDSYESIVALIENSPRVNLSYNGNVISLPYPLANWLLEISEQTEEQANNQWAKILYDNAV